MTLCHSFLFQEPQKKHRMTAAKTKVNTLFESNMANHNNGFDITILSENPPQQVVVRKA